MQHHIIRGLQIILPLSLGILIVWFSLQELGPQDWVHIKNRLEKINYSYFLLAMVLIFLSNLSRARRWQYVLKTSQNINSFWYAYHAVMVSYFINSALPRVGEMSRAIAIHRKENISITHAFGTIVAERGVDFLMMGLISALTFFTQIKEYPILLEKIQQYMGTQDLQSNPMFNHLKQIVAIVLIGTAIVLIALLIFKPNFRIKIKNMFFHFYEGLEMTFRIEEKNQYILHSFFIWFMYILALYLPFLSLENTANIPILGVLSVFVFSTFGVVLVPGGIGATPIICALIAGFYLPNESGHFLNLDAFVLGWISWLTQTAMIVILGAYSFYKLGKK